MYQYFAEKRATARKSSAMETGNHFKTAMKPETIRLQSVAEVKNWASSKSHTSRGYQKAVEI